MSSSYRFSLKSGKNILLVIAYLCLLAGTVLSAIGLCQFPVGTQLAGADLWTFTRFFIPILMFMYICVYMFLNYNKPHGNLLKYLFLAHSFLVIFLSMIDFVAKKDVTNYAAYVGVFASIVAAYMAGRLARIRKNICLGSIELLLSIAVAVLIIIQNEGGNVFFIASVVVIPLQWITIFLSYIVRFEDHKAAGYFADGKE